ncbi:Nucleotide-binding, alpha-beta plait [Niveomyces insectorum RCEF 264]|uniref:Nucleotide-binding, alpha-beta plait n=1 Tax=Niveomyces insectorum RCEF 264 TaxID=1081102 RepID=A0A167NI67_9HYPO|nr:Nucleotide-binding, alpha-beta plait [Niveomyces insectorum RCEF 264]
MAKTEAQKRRREAEADQERRHETTEDAQAAPPIKKARVEERRSIFVRSLPSTATSEKLTDFFSEHFPVKHATVVTDPKTKTSRGYGFVTFTDADDAAEAKAKLDNQIFDGRRLRLDIAEPRHRKTAANASAKSTADAVAAADKKQKREAELAEVRKAPKLIVRNLPWSVKTSADLEKLFRMYGKVKFADLPNAKGKLSGFGFVTLRGKKNAENAILGVNGKVVDGRTLAVDYAVDKSEWEALQQIEKADGPVEEENGKKKAVKNEKKNEKKEKKEENETKGEEKNKPNGKTVTKKEKTAEELQAEEDLRAFMENNMDNLEEEDDSGEEDEEDKDEDDAEEEEDDDDDEDETNNEDDDDDDDEINSRDEKEKVDEEAAAKAKKALVTDNNSTLFVRNLPFGTTDAELKAHFSKFGPLRYARIVMDRTTDRPAGGCQGLPARRPAAPSHGRSGQRRLYLLAEGTVTPASPLYALLPPAERQLRAASDAQRKTLVKNNPALHVSLTRLAVRNLPRHVDSKALKELARKAVVGFATDVKAGRRAPLSKEEIARGGQLDREAEHLRRSKGKGVVDEASGAGRSRGYGFIEYWSHRWALTGLRWLNGHAVPSDNGSKTHRLIVEFAIENANVVARRKTNEERSRAPRAPGAVGAGASVGVGAGAGAGAHAASPQRTRPNGKLGRGDKKGRTHGNKEDAKGVVAKVDKKGKDDRGIDGNAEAAATSSKKQKADTKLAMRQQIIQRKRTMRKKKAQSRRA